MKYKHLSIGVIVSAAFYLNVTTVSAGWYFNNQGQLVYETPGEVLGDSTQDLDATTMQQLLYQMLETTDDAAYDPLLTADPAVLQAKLEELLANIEIYQDETGVIEAIITDPATGTTSTSRVQGDTILTTVTEADGTVTTQTYTLPDAAKNQLVPQAYAADSSLLNQNFNQSTSSADAIQLPTVVEIKPNQQGIGIEAETSSGSTQVSDDILEIDPHIEKERIKLGSDSQGDVVVAQGKVAAKTDKPISLDTTTNNLLIDLNGIKSEVNVLPPAAVAGLLAANVIDQVDPSVGIDSKIQETLPQVESVITLSEHAGSLAYSIDGISEKKLLGFFPVQIKKRVIVSAETGEVIQVQRSFLDRVVELLSV